MRYQYQCRECKWSYEVVCLVKYRDNQPCVKCGSANVDRLITNHAVIGTRDGFGIKNEFRDEESGKTIDNWKSWEKAGYRNPLDVIGNHTVKEKVKRKIDKIKHEKEKI